MSAPQADEAQSTADASVNDDGALSRPLARLRVVHTPDVGYLGRDIELGESLIALGREIDAHGHLIEDRRLSRLHARVTFDMRAGMFRIGDAQSRNGTWVNGRRVDSVLLSDGDVVRIGDTLLVYLELEPMALVRARIERIGGSGLHILLRGDSGTGKEVTARAIHAASRRRGEFLAINCAAIPKDLVAAELFGHTRNAFSGAAQARRGVFSAAEGGTLLLDEIADCPLELQPALLRVLQERAVRPVGAEREIPIDVRVLSATCLDLERAVAEGSFRADLYARLAQTTLELPPLRARRGELLALAAELTPAGAPPVTFSTDAAEALLLWSFPLNVRELQSLVAVAATTGPQRVDLQVLAEIAPKIAEPILARQREVRDRAASGSAQLANAPVEGASSEAPRKSQSGASRAQLRPLLEAHGGNVAAVAQVLGKPRAQVYRWMRSMGLSPERFRTAR